MKDKKKKRRPHFSSTAQTHIKLAATPPSPPASVKLLVRDIPFWDSIVSELSNSEWTPHQTEAAALLARAMGAYEVEQGRLTKEGGVITQKNGNRVANPRRSIVAMYAQTILSLRRSLCLHVRGKEGEARDAIRRRVAEKELVQRAAAPLSDDLIPTAH